MVMKKSTLTTEKAGILAIAMSVLSIGVATLTTASQNIECTWQWGVQIAFGIGMLSIGLTILKLREYLKLNRWSHVVVGNDHPFLERVIHKLEKRK